MNKPPKIYAGGDAMDAMAFSLIDKYKDLVKNKKEQNENLERQLEILWKKAKNDLVK